MENTILIVEDELKIRNGLVAIAKQIRPNINIMEASSKEEAMNIIETNNISAFFLDIKLNDSCGFELASEIREINIHKFTPIVFLTGQYNNRLDAFVNLRCYDYILKPFRVEQLRKVFEDVLYFGINSKQESDVLKLKNKGITYRIVEDEIIFIEYSNKNLIINTLDEKLSFQSYSLMQVMSMVTIRFIQCHKSFIVNRDYIKCINNKANEVVLKSSNQFIPIGRKYKTKLGGKWCQ